MFAFAVLTASLLCTATAVHNVPAWAVEQPGDLRTCFDAHGPGSLHCQKPGTCTPPPLPHSAVATGPAPGLQWNINGGFCGAFSVQQGALSVGAWISQDHVRKSNAASPGPHNMHGDTSVGFEVMPSNVKFTADHLRLLNDEFDYTQPSPQAAAWKQWAKSHLVKRRAIVFFPMCKGDPHQCYPGSCPNGGSCDHVESLYGIFSNHSLDDLTVYPDDVVVHTSNQDCFPYYRRMDSLEDSTAMEGNCKDAGAGFGHNEMYPCIDEDVTYGLAVTGLAVNGTSGKTSMQVKLKYEPNVRNGDKPVAIHPAISVTGLNPSKSYRILRYVGTDTLPAGPPFSSPNATTTVTAGPDGKASWADAPPFMSDDAVYHLTVASD